MATATDEALAALEAAGERQREIDRLIGVQQAILDELTEQRRNKGRGRPNTAHAAKKAAAESKIARLQRGLLPDESAAPLPRTAEELRASALQHPQHHAAAGGVPVGRAMAPAAAQGDDDGEGEGDGGDDDDKSDGEFDQF